MNIKATDLRVGDQIIGGTVRMVEVVNGGTRVRYAVQGAPEWRWVDAADLLIRRRS